MCRFSLLITGLSADNVDDQNIHLSRLRVIQIIAPGKIMYLLFSLPLYLLSYPFWKTDPDNKLRDMLIGNDFIYTHYTHLYTSIVT